MVEFSKKYLSLKRQVKALEAKLDAKRTALQKVCPHSFPDGISFTDCIFCGMSSYYKGREDTIPSNPYSEYKCKSCGESRNGYENHHCRVR